MYYLELRHLWVRFRKDKVNYISRIDFNFISILRQTADLFAEAGYLVIIPDFYRGSWCDPSSPEVVTFLQDKTQWQKLKQDLDTIVMPFARSKGGEVFGALGTCWGSYMVLRECGTYPEVSQKYNYRFKIL